MSQYSPAVDPAIGSPAARSFTTHSTPIYTTNPQILTNQPMNPAHFSINNTVIAASPSSAFASLQIKTPIRPIPQALPPTPNLPSGSPPKLASPALPFGTPEASSSTSTPPSRASLSQKYKEMLSKGNKKSAMGPPPAPAIVTHDTPPQDELWDGMNDFFNVMDHASPMLDSLASPIVGPGYNGTAFTTPINMSGMGGADFADLFPANLVEGHSNPTSPIIQLPLHHTPLTGVLPFSPVMNFDDAAAAYLTHPGSGSTEQFSELMPSPAHTMSGNPSPHIPSWDAPNAEQFSLFPLEGEPTIVPGRNHPGLTMSQPTTSQESAASSISHPASAPPSAALSPSTSKRPRLSSSASHQRYHSASSASSAAPSPHVGPIRGPTGYRKNLKPDDLLRIDAPTQRRNYKYPSMTSRKDLPPSVTRTFHPPESPTTRKRSSSQAGLVAHDDAQQVGPSSSSDDAGQQAMDEDEDDEKQALLQHVEDKRRANTIAARKSRLRKAQFIDQLKLQISNLEQEKAQLEQENRALGDKYRLAEQRAVAAEDRLRVLGLYNVTLP